MYLLSMMKHGSNFGFRPAAIVQLELNHIYDFMLHVSLVLRYSSKLTKLHIILRSATIRFTLNLPN